MLRIGGRFLEEAAIRIVILNLIVVMYVKRSAINMSISEKIVRMNVMSC